MFLENILGLVLPWKTLICKLHSCFSLVGLPIVCKSALTGYDSVSYYSVYQLRCPFGFTELVIALIKLVWTYFTDLFQNRYFYPFWFSSGPLFAEGLKHSTIEISESVNVSQNTLPSMSFFSSPFHLLVVNAWQRHLTSLFHVFVSRQRWILCLSFKVWGLQFFTIHECTNLHLWGVWNPVYHIGLWQGTKKSWNIQSDLWWRCLSSSHCLFCLSQQGTVMGFFRTAF